LRCVGPHAGRLSDCTEVNGSALAGACPPTARPTDGLGRASCESPVIVHIPHVNLLTAWFTRTFTSQHPCPQQVVRVGPVELGERPQPSRYLEGCGTTRHTDKRAALHPEDRRPTSQASASQTERGSRPTRRHHREDPRDESSSEELRPKL